MPTSWRLQDTTRAATPLPPSRCRPYDVGEWPVHFVHCMFADTLLGSVPSLYTWSAQSLHTAQYASPSFSAGKLWQTSSISHLLENSAGMSCCNVALTICSIVKHWLASLGYTQGMQRSLRMTMSLVRHRLKSNTEQRYVTWQAVLSYLSMVPSASLLLLLLLLLSPVLHVSEYLLPFTAFSAC